ncbi:Mu transposase domain-containing protein [Streptomyces sp. NPDC000880]
MLALPPVDPPRWWRFHTRIGRDHYIRVDTCDYSVHPMAIGKAVVVRTDTEEVTALLTPGGRQVAGMPAAGPDIRRSPIPTTPAPPLTCAGHTATSRPPRPAPRPPHPSTSTWSNADWTLMTGCSPSSRGAQTATTDWRRRDGPHCTRSHQQQGSRSRPSDR